MDYYTILAQQKQLNRELAGSRIEVLRRNGPYTVYVGFSGEKALKLAAIPDMPYLARAEFRYIPKRDAKPWHQNRFEHHSIDHIEIVQGDRVLSFVTDSGMRIVFELTGRHANIVIVDAEGVITGVLRPVTAGESTVREVVPGILYTPPPLRDFPDLIWNIPNDLDRCLFNAGGTTMHAVQHGLACGSSLFAKEACARAGVPTDSASSDLGNDDRYRLYQAASEIASSIESGGYGGTVVFRNDGLPRDVFPLPVPSYDGKSEPFDDLFEAVSTYARTREIELERRSLRASIISALAAEEKRVRRTMTRVEQERGGDNEPERLEQEANTILANIHRIGRGAHSVTLENIMTGESVDIDLDPALDAPTNARRMFKRAKKLRAAAQRAAARYHELSQRLQRITDDRAMTETLEDIRELKKHAARFASQRQHNKTDDGEPLFPRRYTSPAGLEIIVGRNDRENDELVRWAKKTDIWLHAQYIGGSHVILRTPGRQNADHQSVERAAAIAAYYSKGKTSAMVPVVCTEVKYVTKRKGMGPGKVHYTRERVLLVEPRHRWDP